MIKFYFSDGTSLQLDQTKYKNYSDIKHELFKNKFNFELKHMDDITLITYGIPILNNDMCNCINNQTFLVKINIDIEISKMLNDDRLIKLISDKASRIILYEILDNPKLLKSLEKYKYQKELDMILNIGIPSSVEDIKKALDSNLGNIEIVINTILNL